MTFLPLDQKKTWRCSLLAATCAVIATGVLARAEEPPVAARARLSVDLAASPSSAGETGAVAADGTPAADLLEPAAPGPRFWGAAEYLLWWLKGDRLPPLVTGSPLGTPITDAGVFGVPGTTVIFGDSRVNDEVRSGGRFTLGYWLDDDRNWGVGGDFFILETKADGFAASSNGSPILARPFFDTEAQAQASESIAFPGVIAGNVAVTTSSEFLGADAFVRKNLCCGCNYRIDFLAGYRFLHLKEGLRIEEQLVSTSTAPDQPPPGTVLDVVDRFDTENRFHGGDLGLLMSWWRNRLSVDVLTRLGLGGTERIVQINGGTSITVPNQGTETFPGGFLALETNSGRFKDHTFSFVPELRLNVGYQLTDRLRAFVGYTLLFWTDVARPGDQIDLRINPNFLPPVIGGGERSPSFRLKESDLWVQGINLGLSFNY